MPRIVSLLPAGTEIAYALGAGPDLVGRSHECDFPAAARRLPVVSRPALQLEGLAPAEVDQAVARRLENGESLYQIDERLLQELEPDVILTQNLCQVCAPSGNELSRALRDFPREPTVVWLSPRTLTGIEQDILAVGEATGTQSAARALVAKNRQRIARVRAAVALAPRRSVVFLEWVEPPFAAGHWIPEMIEAAGGSDPLGRAGADSERVDWSRVVEAGPEIVIVAPCGFDLPRAARLGREVPPLPNAAVYAVDANAYFARPGPRAAEGIELLAHLFHPDRYQWPHPGAQPWQSLLHAVPDGPEIRKEGLPQ